MINPLPPAAIFILGALLIPAFRGKSRNIFLLAVPVLAMAALLYLPRGISCQMEFLTLPLTFCRVDGLSRVFGIVFILITGIGMVYALHVKDTLQHAAAFLYAGGALGVTFAGDLFSLFFFWELMAGASTVFLLARRTREARRAAFRYFMWHFFGGVCLLAGIVTYVLHKGTPQFDFIGLGEPGTLMILIGFGLNAAIFPLHAWLPDAYPRATVTGAVFMSALTTKSAVYILARTFPGTEILIWAGAFMTCFPIFYAVIANDMRRVLSYSLINQVGFMVCGIGIGSELAINGVAAHAFCHIIYKALLFMSMGAVLQMTGKIRATDLGGLYKHMPLTTVFCIIGAASISAFPLFSGFISKSLTVAAVAEAHQVIVWFMLLFASAGVFHHAGIKVPYFAFFSHDSGIITKEPPLNMRLAMGAAALICVILGVWPTPLYAILPFPVDYQPYTLFHVIGMLELLMFGALAFTVLMLSGIYPPELRAVNLDTDWLARMPGRAFIRWCKGPLGIIEQRAGRAVAAVINTLKKSVSGSSALEDRFDRFYHDLPGQLIGLFQKALVPLNTESRQISWNLFYILVPFIVFLVFILMTAKGGGGHP